MSQDILTQDILCGSVKEVPEFIARRFLGSEAAAKWQDGNCYFFAVILKDRFPGGQIVYEPLQGHFMYFYQGELFDSGGCRGSWDVAADRDKYYIFDELRENDELLYNRLIRDCVH